MADWPKNAYGTALVIAAGVTDTTAGIVIEVGDQEEVLIQLRATGANAGSSGTVKFYLASSVDGINYSTVGTELTLTLSTNQAVISEPTIIHTGRRIRYMKFIKVINGDAAFGITGVNAIVNGVECGF
ncbi:MAG TPA: hypothetical protein VLH13_00695 [Methanomassiliicoccales archaeon]|nr:hypothetical protein [Methanomassiliicoccales archaeon]